MNKVCVEGIKAKTDLMKKLFTLLIFIISCFNLQAQQVVFNQNFEAVTGYNPPTGWTYTQYWQCGLPYLIGGICHTPPVTTNNTKVLGITDRHAFQQSPCNMSNNLINSFISTPSINFTTVTGAWLRFDSWFVKETQNNLSEGAYIEVSTDAGNNWTRIFNVPGYAPGFKTYYVNLGAYNNASTINLGFRYSDSGQIRTGWMIDNIQVFVPANKDLKLMSIIPQDSLLRYVTIGDALALGGTVYNAGLDTAHSFDLKYKAGNASVKSCTISGITLAPFDSASFFHNILDTVFTVAGDNIKMWVDLPGDNNHTNDTQATQLRGAYFMPKKKALVEEGTGTWNPQCPRGWVYMNNIPQDGEACLISVHDYDPMVLQDYDDFLFSLRYNYVPYYLFDRRLSADTSQFYEFFYKSNASFGFADILLDGNIFGNTFTVNAHLKPAVDLTGDYRLAMVVTEDGVKGTTNGYRQLNYFAGGLHGPMGGFENLPDTVPAASMTYNFVARATTPAPDGTPGLLPNNLVHGATYNQTFTAQLNSAWNKTKLKAIVMLVRYSDSSVLNANSLRPLLGVNNINEWAINAGLYPNPSAEQTHLFFELNQAKKLSISITDLTGKLLYMQPVSTYEAGRHDVKLNTAMLSSGIYLVTVATEDGKKAIKLEVMH